MLYRRLKADIVFFGVLDNYTYIIIIKTFRVSYTLKARICVFYLSLLSSIQSYACQQNVSFMHSSIQSLQNSRKLISFFSFYRKKNLEKQMSCSHKKQTHFQPVYLHFKSPLLSLTFSLSPGKALSYDHRFSENILVLMLGIILKSNIIVIAV